jgi:protease II
MQLSVYNKNHTLLWKREPVGPDAAFNGNDILFQTVENQLRYPGIMKADKHTGKGEILLFEEPDKRYQVELSQPPYQEHIFIKVRNALDQRLAIYDKTKFTWFTPKNKNHSKSKSQSLFPIKKDIYGTDTDIIIHNVKYPLMPNEFLVDAIMTNNIILYTTTHLANMSLYAFDINKKQISRLFQKDYPCDIKLRKYPKTPTVEIGFPHKASSIYIYIEETNQLKKIRTFPEPVELEFKHGFAKSKDGTKVPYTLVYKRNKNHKNHTMPNYLFTEGYGSYGISSRRSYPVSRLAWLNQGYAYAVSFARGGREDGDRWYDGGRTALRKQNTFDDTAAVIQEIQTTYNFSPKNTIFYGRSAGGLLAANIATQYPHLVKAIYAEVPYLDVLRTTSNPDLPLTQMEYDEFGDPATRPDERIAIQTFSPVDTVPNIKNQTQNQNQYQYPFIVVKTALNDSQVLPYETLKWAKKLRENGWKVFVGIDGGGHFVDEDNLYKGLAEDAVLLNINQNQDKGLGLKTRRASQVSSGTTRRKTSSSKHLIKHRTSSAAE